MSSEQGAQQGGSGRDRGGRFAPGTSGNPSGRKPRRDHRDRIDGLVNALTGVGVVGKDKRLGAYFCSEPLVPQQAHEWWRGHDLAARIVEGPVNEMLREGWCLKVAADEADAAARGAGRRYDDDQSQEVSDEITARLEDLDFESALRDALCYERALGGPSAVLIGANDGQELDQPLNIERVMSVDFFTALEPDDLTIDSYYANPGAPKFGQPAVYMISTTIPGQAYQGDYGQPAGVRVHESRMIVFHGVRTSRRYQQSSNRYTGDSVLTRVHRVLSDYDMSWNAAAILLHDFAQAIYKLKDLATLVAQDTAEADNVVKTRLAAVELSRSVARAIVIDAEEEFERKQTPISGLPDMLDRFALRVAAAAEMQVTELFGDSPSGMNATGESDVRLKYDRIRATQKRKLRQPIEYVCKILFATMGGEPAQWSVEFHPLWQPSGKEKAEERKLIAETDAIYIENQVLMPEEVTRARFGGDEFSSDTQIDMAAHEQELEELRQAEAEEAQRQAEALAASKSPPQGEEEPPAPDEPRMDTIQERGGKYVVFSEDGSREFGTYETREEAIARLRQIEHYSDEGAPDEE